MANRQPEKMIIQCHECEVFYTPNRMNLVAAAKGNQAYCGACFDSKFEDVPEDHERYEEDIEMWLSKKQ